MSELTPAQRRAMNHVSAANAILSAKMSEYDAALYIDNRTQIAAARDAVHSATDALLDARERAFRALDARESER